MSDTEEPQTGEFTPEQHAQFSKLADLARKYAESKIGEFSEGATAPLIDSYNAYFAILCGFASATVTCLVGLGDKAGESSEIQAGMLNGMVNQMAGVFNEIQERKAALAAATDGATVQ